MLEGLSSGWGARDSKGWGFGNFSLRPAPGGWENQGIPGLGAFEDRGWLQLSRTTRSLRSGISVPPSPRGVCAPAPPGDESPGKTGKAGTRSDQPRPAGGTGERSARPPGQPRPRNAPGGGAGTHRAVHVAVKSGTWTREHPVPLGHFRTFRSGTETGLFVPQGPRRIRLPAKLVPPPTSSTCPRTRHQPWVTHSCHRIRRGPGAGRWRPPSSGPTATPRLVTRSAPSPPSRLCTRYSLLPEDERIGRQAFSIQKY